LKREVEQLKVTLEEKAKLVQELEQKIQAFELKEAKFAKAKAT